MLLIGACCLLSNRAFATKPGPHLIDLTVFRQQIDTDARLAALWTKLQRAAQEDLNEPAWTPATPLPGREESHVRRQNPNDGLIRRTGRRLERAALVYRITGDDRYVHSAWRQIVALFDDQQWPDWRDRAHRGPGSRVDLRTGDLSAALGLTYDWLRDGLTPEQQAIFRTSVRQRVLDPFFADVDESVWWLTAGHNWTTRIVGGIGILGMALRDDDPRTDRLMAIADRAMFDYLDQLGSDGSFNESPGYVGDLAAVARYFWVRGSDQLPRLDRATNQAIARLTSTVHWTVWTLMPGFRQIALGDTKTTRRRSGEFAGAIAAASGDGLVQWLFLSGNGLAEEEEPRRLDPEAVLAYRPAVASTPPEEVLPRARAYDEQGGLLVSRTGWDLSADSRDVVVVGKHGREANHDHDDVGQVTMTVGTTPIIAEVGNNFTYPADYFGPNRRAYYPAAARGHNVMTFGDAADGEMLPRGQGRRLDFKYDDQSTYWKIDLSEAYRGERHVQREVLHVLPAVLVVLDEVTLPTSEHLTLRWHTGSEPTVNDRGHYRFRVGNYQTLLQTVAVEGKTPPAKVDRHGFRPPFDTSRDGQPLPQYHEPFVAMTTEADHVRWLTIVATTDHGPPPTIERMGKDGWRISTGDQQGTVRVTSDGLTWQP